MSLIHLTSWTYAKCTRRIESVRFKNANFPRANTNAHFTTVKEIRKKIRGKA